MLDEQSCHADVNAGLCRLPIRVQRQDRWTPKTAGSKRITYGSTNYWVGVVFAAAAKKPALTNSDSGFVTVKNTPLSIPALLGNDTDPNGYRLPWRAWPNRLTYRHPKEAGQNDRALSPA
jgi:hypothetical protein